MSSMLRAWSLSALLAAAPFALIPAIGHAQLGTGLHFNLAAGLSEPTGTLGDAYNAGYNLIVGVGISPPASPLGFRVEGIYNEFGQNDQLDQFGGGDKASAGGVTVNAVYDLIHPTPLQSNALYLIGGVGYYSTHEYFDDQNQTNPGFNVGAGFKFPLTGFSVYIEARYHTVQNTDVRFVPISFGLIF